MGELPSVARALRRASERVSPRASKTSTSQAPLARVDVVLPARRIRVSRLAIEGLALLSLLAAGTGCHHAEAVKDGGQGKIRPPEPLVTKACTGGTPESTDVNNDGKPDIVHHVDGGKRTCSEIDMNFDGKVDVYRFYADDGKTVAFEQHDYDFDGRLDEQTFFEAGALKRKELDTNFDGLVDTWLWCAGPLVEQAERARRKPGRVDTWETYQNGLLAQIEYDENSDGRVEKWELFKDGLLTETRIDTTGDGQVDRTEIASMEGEDDRDKPVSCDGSPLPLPNSSAPAGGAPAAPAPASSGGEAPASDAAPASEGTKEG
jgi:hypothetical protein